MAIVRMRIDSSDMTFGYSLTEPMKVSAGVYNSNGALVRTLFNAEQKTAGPHVEIWDKKDDLGNDVANPAGYTVQVLKHNIVAEPEGARIGNSSDAISGPTIHAGAAFYPLDLAITGNYLYYPAGYREVQETAYRTSLDNIGSVFNVMGGKSYTGDGPLCVCTDGTYVYWGTSTEGSGLPGSWVFATRVDDNSLKTFSSGVTVVHDYGPNPPPSVISYKTSGDIQSMAVNGSKLFVSRLNQIEVLNKNTGQSLQTITVSGTAKLAVDGSGNLWVGLGNSVTKYTVNNDGSITSTGITLSGITSAAAIAVSPDNATVIIADDALTQQVVKGFNNSAGGSAAWTLGVAGGYQNNATVNNNKFYFSDLRRVYKIGLSFQPDGSFWITDPGNSRIQHYSASRSFVNRIEYIGSSNYVQIEPNNISKLFATIGTGGILEFAIDYTKTLDNGSNGSWTLVNNWGGAVQSTGYIESEGMRNVVTINGRTFGRFSLYTSDNANPLYQYNRYNDYYELVEGGVLRKTKLLLSPQITIGKNGDKYELANEDNKWKVYKYAFTGLDGDNDPTWSTTYQLIVTTPSIAGVAHVFSEYPFHENITSSNKWIFFDQSIYTDSYGADFHLSGIQVGGNDYQFKTSYGTLQSYSGDFPVNYYDNGNLVQKAGSFCSVTGNLILWNYIGEFWKQASTNMYNLFWENGLLVGQFGTLGTEHRHEIGILGAASNASKGSLVSYSPDIAYLYHSDEGVNGGLGRYKISGLASISVQTINFNPSLVYVPAGVSLMTEFTSKGYLTNTGRWTVTDPNPQLSPGLWYAALGNKTPSLTGLQDLYAYTNRTDQKQITCSLGNNTGLNSWKISGNLSFQDNVPAVQGSRGAYLQVLDAAGKVIVSLRDAQPTNGGHSDIRGNNVVVRNITVDDQAAIKIKYQPFEISTNNGTITFKYAGASASTTVVTETGADMQNPTMLRMLYVGNNGDGSGSGMGVSQLKFQNTSAQ